MAEPDTVGRHAAGTDGPTKSSEAGDFDAGLEAVELDHSPVPHGPPSPPPVAPIAPRRVIDPPASADGYAQLQQRIRQRRIDGRIEAARAALAQRRFDDAAAALDELIELDPGLPILGELTAELNQRHDAAAIGHRGSWMVAAAAAACALALFVLLESSSQKSGLLVSHPTLTVAPTPPASAVAPAAGPRTDKPIAGPALPGNAQPSTVVDAGQRRPDTLVEPEPPQPTPEALPTRQKETAAVAITSPAAPESASIPIDDEALIRQTLRRYQDAYRTLDAQSAQAIQPTVDQASLAATFDGPQTPSLVFDACQMEVSGSSARAICRGAARDVPKFRRREPRTERRVWSFTLIKHDGDWTIETARTDQ
jgi:hypothetical protein